MKTSDDFPELAEVDRTTLVSVDVLPQAQLRTTDQLCVRERCGDREALGTQPSRQRHLTRHVRRQRSHSDYHIARAEHVVGTCPQRPNRVFDPVPTSNHGCQPRRMVWVRRSVLRSSEAARVYTATQIPEGATRFQ